MTRINLNRFGFSLLLVLILLLSACQPTTLPTPVVTEPVEETLPANALPTALPTQAPTPTIQPTIALDYKTLKGLTIDLMHPFVDQETLFNQLIRDFNLENPWGIHVSGNTAPGYPGVAQALATQENQPDMVIGMGADLVSSLPSINWLNLQAYSEDPNYGLAETYYDESIYNQTQRSRSEETFLSLPLAYNPGLIYFNQSWAAELGFDGVPQSFEEMAEIQKAAMTFNAQDENYLNNGTGGLWLSQSSLSALSWYNAFGGGLDDPQNGFEPDEAALLGSFEALRTAFLSDLTWIGVEPSPYRYLADRYAVAYEGSLLDLSNQTAYQSASQFQGEWTTLPYFTLDGEPVLVLEPLSFAIPQGDEKSQLAAWLFGMWLLEPSQQEKLVTVHRLWPSIGQPDDVAPTFAQENPAWAASLANSPLLTVTPLVPSWSQTQLVFQDAYQRVYNLDAQFFPSILEVFKETLRINLEQQP